MLSISAVPFLVAVHGYRFTVFPVILFFLFIITPAIKYINCHAGLDPASSLILDSRFRGNDALSYIVADVITVN